MIRYKIINHQTSPPTLAMRLTQQTAQLQIKGPLYIAVRFVHLASQYTNLVLPEVPVDDLVREHNNQSTSL